MSFRQKTYSIQGDGYHFDTGLLSNGHQMLMGVQLPEIVAVEFDAEGNFLTILTRRISAENETVSLFDKIVQEGIDQWKKEINLEPDAISIKGFFINDRWIGIADLPDHYVDFIENPGNYSQDDARSFADEIQQWREREAFVLYFTEDYYMNGDGELESS